MTKPRSYLLCGTPRTGSTLLCGLLASTGVAGRPESYFREADLSLWAGRFGVPAPDEASFDYRAFVAGAIRAGTSPNGVFAARVMWGTTHLIVDGLAPGPQRRGDVDVLNECFGPLDFVHLRRLDVVSQAVSWARAEQTGYWQEGDIPGASPRLDLDLVDELVRMIHEHNAAWSTWFAEQEVDAHLVTYEELIADPLRTVHGLLHRLGVEPPKEWRPGSGQRRQADEVNADWVRRYRTASWRHRLRREPMND